MEDLKAKDRRFSAADPAVIEKLPPHVKGQYQFIPTHRGAIDKRTVNVVSALLVAGGGVGFESIAKVMKEMACLEFLHVELIYYQTMEAIQLRRAQEQTAQQRAHAVVGAQPSPQAAQASLGGGGRSERPAEISPEAGQDLVPATGQPGSRSTGTIDRFFQRKVASKPPTAEAACLPVCALAEKLRLSEMQ